MKNFFIFLILCLFSQHSLANNFVKFYFNDSKMPTVSWKTKKNYYIKNISIKQKNKNISITKQKNEIKITGTHNKGKLILNYTGCISNMCQPIQRDIFFTKFEKKSYFDFLSKNNDTNYFISLLKNNHFAFSLLLFFIFGLLLAFTPCIFPMLPIVSSMVLKYNHKNPLATSFFYVLGSATSYAFIGFIMGFLNFNIQIYFQKPLYLIITGLFFILLSYLMIVDYSKSYFIFNKFNKSNMFFHKIIEKINKESMIAVFIVGFFSSLIISPCAAPPIVAVLFFMQTNHSSIIEQIIILFVIGIGAGIPLILISTSLKKILPNSGQWMNEIKILFSFILLILANYIFQKSTEHNLNSFYIILFLTYLFHFFTKNKKHIFVFFVGLMLLNSYYLLNNLKEQHLSTYYHSTNNLKKEIQYQTIKNPKELNYFLVKAKKEKKPVFIDIYADWCDACQEMKNNTLKNKNIVNYLNKYYAIAQINITKFDKPKEKILNSYKLQTAPAYIFYNKIGKKNKKIFVGYIKKEEFLNIIKTNAQ